MIRSLLLDQVPNIKYHLGSLKDPQTSLIEFEKLKPQWQQIHQNLTVRVTKTSQKCGNADGLYTQANLTPIGVLTADCVPILLARKDGSGVATLHSGWRGTSAKITKKFFDTYKENFHDWFCVLGPAIKWCCYEVSRELLIQFSTEYSDISSNVFIKNNRYLDLQNLIQAECRDYGLETEKIELCTYCTTYLDVNGSKVPLFSSYRRNPDKTRQLSILQLAN